MTDNRPAAGEAVSPENDATTSVDDLGSTDMAESGEPARAGLDAGERLSLERVTVTGWPRALPFAGDGGASEAEHLQGGTQQDASSSSRNDEPQLESDAARMRRGRTARETCDLNGWGVGTTLRGHEQWADGRGIWTTIRITAVGEESILARTVWEERTDADGEITHASPRSDREGTWTLALREWTRVSPPGDHAVTVENDAPRFYLGLGIDQRRCAACAACPTLPCADHRDLPACTGAGDCPGGLHEHGCYADRDGSACNDPDDHASPCAVCETRGPKWCDEHGPLLIGAEPTRPLPPGTGELDA